MFFDAENFKIKRVRKQRKQPQRYGSNVTRCDLALVAATCSFLSILIPKLPHVRRPNERNLQKPSLKINFQSRWSKKNVFKLKSVNLARRTHQISCRDVGLLERNLKYMYQLILRCMLKFFPRENLSKRLLRPSLFDDRRHRELKVNECTVKRLEINKWSEVFFFFFIWLLYR